MDAFQFYPTPASLAARAWAKFKKRDFKRVLEPSAGAGDLALAHPESSRYRQHMHVDCCEIDVSKHAALRSHHFHVVGVDFLQFGSGAVYSHVIMNPPFAHGVQHVLKAWDCVFEAEIVAIVNAETVRNPFSAERKRLVRLIEQHGEVEFIANAFQLPDAERKAGVEIALIYLHKQADVNGAIIGDLLGELREEGDAAARMASQFREQQAVALPNSEIENQVLAFQAATRAMHDAVFAEARAMYYCALLGDKMVDLTSKAGPPPRASTVDFVRNEIAARYDGLKDRAWAGILRSTQFTQRLSSNARKQLEASFADIKRLEFTVANIYGFLCGLMENQGDIQIGMACDLFDLFTRYHSDNLVFFRGWKSNDKHRTCAMRLKTTRLVVPGFRSERSDRSLPYNAHDLLRDIDKVFAMLDGKAEPEQSLLLLCRDQFTTLRDGARLSSSYFDVRYYPGAGTFHFFPKSKVLMDRLNRMVGRQRDWLPPPDVSMADGFWQQYERAEQFDAEVRKEAANQDGRSWHRDPLDWATSLHEDRREEAHNAINRATAVVLARHGIDIDFRIEASQQPLLLSA